MNTEIKNGKWQVAFWVMTFVCGTILAFGATAIITNDRLSRARDEKIVEKVNCQYADIVQRLARIETKLEK
jgi:hypothetical protein